MAIRKWDAILCSLLFAEGFILMGFEMLASRFLNPYFGSTIETWACIISVVLVAMALGYFAGGFLSNRARAHFVLPVVTVVSGLYLIAIAYLSKPVLTWIVSALGSGFYPTLLSAFALMAVPVFLMSFWSPIVVGLISRNSARGSAVAGYVYGLSTVGNVFGTLVTAFVLVPNFGSISIALMFGAALLVIAVVYAALLLGFGVPNGGVQVGILVACALLISPTSGRAEPTEIVKGRYPEGVLVNDDGSFYFAQMTADAVSLVEGGKVVASYELKGCGPTGVTRLSKGTLAIACHRSATILIVRLEDNTLQEIATSADGLRFTNPNDINADGLGGAFFSDPGPFNPAAGAVGRVFRLDASLNVHLVSDGLVYPNGVAYDADGQTLYVSEHLQRRITAIPLDDTFKQAGPPQVFFDFAAEPMSKTWGRLTGPDGLRLAGNGELVVAIYGGGGVAVVGKCGLASWLEGFPAFTTSVGLSGQDLIVAGADSNSESPFWGKVMSVGRDQMSHCARDAG